MDGGVAIGECKVRERLEVAAVHLCLVREHSLDNLTQLDVKSNNTYCCDPLRKVGMLSDPEESQVSVIIVLGRQGQLSFNSR